MLIRSQDKVDLVNMDKVAVITANTLAAKEGRFVIGIGNPPETLNTYTIGKYSTYEKALKVLDMIQDNYRELYGPVVMGRISPDPVFQMPQDDEVEENEHDRPDSIEE